MKALTVVMAAGALAAAFGVAGCGITGSKPAPPKEQKTLTLTLAKDVEMTLTLIPAGKFTMGSPLNETGRDDDEGPQKQVTLSKPFYMGRTHVTVDQFAAFVKASGYQTDAEKDGWSFVVEIKDGKFDVRRGHGASWRKPGMEQKGDHPVVHISWNDAVAFCNWLSKQSGKVVRLPTEAEWEYACRAGTTTAHPWGDKPDDGKGWANAGDQSLRKAGHKAKITADSFFSWDDGFVFTSPAGSFKTNGFGLHDMIGNAGQWCSDWYGPYGKATETDPTGPATGKLRMLRGGSWCSPPQFCRSAHRGGTMPGLRFDSFGFRVAVSAGVD
jgi:formylglycine-generating enzyme